MYSKSVDEIHEDPTNPRFQSNEGYTEQSLKELAEDILERGLLNPLTVTPHPDLPNQFLLISGHRRLRAAKLAGLRKVPVVVRITNDLKGDQIAENIHRADLNHVEIASIIEGMKNDGLSVRDIARRLHKSVGYVSNYQRYLKCSEKYRRLISEGMVSDVTAIPVLDKASRVDEAAIDELIANAREEGEMITLARANRFLEIVKLAKQEKDGLLHILEPKDWTRRFDQDSLENVEDVKDEEEEDEDFSNGETSTDSPSVYSSSNNGVEVTEDCSIVDEEDDGNANANVEVDDEDDTYVDDVGEEKPTVPPAFVDSASDRQYFKLTQRMIVVVDGRRGEIVMRCTDNKMVKVEFERGRWEELNLMTSNVRVIGVG